MTSPYLDFWWEGRCAGPSDSLLAWARAQRLLPLLGWRAEQQGWALPEQLRPEIQGSHYRVAARLLMVEKQLHELEGIASRLQIPVAVVKGPVVAESYPDPALRPYSDIDLLVPHAAVHTLFSTLQEEGYSPRVTGDRALHYPPLEPPRAGLRLEIHTTLAQTGRQEEAFSFQAWADDLIPWESFPGLRVPHPVDHLLYVLYHEVERHHFEIGLLPLVDLRFWTQDWGSDEWEALQVKVEELGLQRAVTLATALASWFWREPSLFPLDGDWPVPPSQSLEVAKKIVVGDNTRLLPHLWRDLPERNLRGWLAYAQMVLLGDPEKRRHLGAREKLFFYLSRPVRVIKHYTPALIALLRGDASTRQAWQARRELMEWLHASE